MSMHPPEADKKLTVDELMQILCEAAIPLELLSTVERYKPWLSVTLQEGIDSAVRKIRDAVIHYGRERITAPPQEENK